MIRRVRVTDGPKGDINVTPLVDVVLVLLIIFMVITPMLQKGKDVQLPQTDHPKKAKDIKEQLTLSVTADGRIFWEEGQLSTTELGQRMRQTHAETPTRPIFVKGDARASYGTVRQVMKLVNEAGFETVGVITKERDK